MSPEIDAYETHPYRPVSLTPGGSLFEASQVQISARNPPRVCSPAEWTVDESTRSP